MSSEAQVLLFSGGHSSAKLVYSGGNDDSYVCYPAPISSSRLPYTPTHSKYLPRLPKYRDTSHAIDGKRTWDISLVASVILAIICIVPVPICSIVTFAFTYEALKAGKLGRYKKRDTKKNWALCCSMIAFITGALTLASLSTLIGFAIAYW